MGKCVGVRGSVGGGGRCRECGQVCWEVWKSVLGCREVWG